jgi:hypothetical protein
MMKTRRHPQELAPTVSLRTITLVIMLTAFPAYARAAVIDADPSNYEGVVASLAAGDTLRLASGTYTHGLLLDGKAGTATQPIVVTGPEDQSAVFTARNCCSTVQLDGTSYVRVLNLTLNGSTSGGHSAVDARAHTHHVTLENLKIVDSTGEHCGPVSADTTYSVACMDAAASKTVRIAVAPTPTVMITAAPPNVAAGGTSVLSWTSTAAVGCSASGGWMGTKGPNGSETVGPLQATTSFQLTCLGEGGNANAIVQVTVGGATPPPTQPPPTQPPPTQPPPTQPPPTQPPPTQPPPTQPPPMDPPPPTQPPPMDPPPTQPPPTDPPPTDPPPTQPSPPMDPPSAPPANPPSSSAMSSRGGGSLDMVAVLFLAICTALRLGAASAIRTRGETRREDA